jgi:hypothetical protein
VFVATEVDRITRSQLLALTGAGCLMLLLIGWTRPISDVDLFWQVKLGELIWSNGKLVTADPFTFTHGGQTFPPVCWLAQVVYAGVYSLGGWRLLQGLDNLLFVGALLVAGLAACKPQAERSEAWGSTSLRPLAAVAAVAVGFIVALPHNSLRPQTFAVFGLALLLALHSSRLPAWLKITLGGLLLLVWQNLHPSVLVAGIALAPLAAAEAWDWFRGRKPEQLGVTVALLVLVALCEFATPMGAGLLDVSRRNAELSRTSPQPPTEWMPCWEPQVRTLALSSVGVGVAVTLGLLVLSRFRVKLGDLLLIVVMTGLALSALRFGLFMAVALVPIWARLFDAVLPREQGHGTEARPAPGFLWPICAVVVLLAALLPVVFRPQEFASDMPWAGVRKLKDTMPAGRIYDFAPYGGPLIWEGYPDWQLLTDGRIYFFSDAEWREYYDAADGQVAVDTLVDHHSPDAFFLHPFVQHGLIEKLEQHPQWQRIHKDDTCQVFIRKQATSTVAWR